ncbi:MULTISPECIES: LacI family DNA-binding transcriptional regulator [unclassified Chelatococcus]|uniref:LacI family DNA-binding transcriptional regulator n=1 Tax=unclassified Chelatococcus TaxID=2638111 RepID=UPI001BCF221A|nr:MULTISPECIES: LacI family DNA-binding transcriptional regulator [unclassified Chelatococcus]MBS7701132.1 LacI family DNA-binding transcriptional regulator [Chelatococcus sp. YT9]MBX3557263.1 LacI family DNA-binding transcriptional regulator [Chelatococcus sp.]
MSKKPAAARQTQPSLRHVAERANVSVMTVSNVINGRMARVGKEVAERVRAAIDELGYRPQRSGRSLRLQREFALGLTVMHPDRRFLDDPYITQVAAGMSNYLATVGYGLMVNGLQDQEALAAFVGRSTGYDGFAVMVSGERGERVATYRTLAQLNLPMLIVQDLPPDDMTTASSVRQDDRGGAAALAEDLLRRNVSRLLCVMPRQIWPGTEQRAAGIAEATRARIAAGQLTVDYFTSHEEDFETSVEEIVEQLSNGPVPDAIMGGNDQLGLAAIQAATRCGFEVPGDIMVTGFNAFWFRKFSTPVLSSVTSPAYEIGLEAAQMLVRAINGEEPGGLHKLLPVYPAAGGSIRPADEDRIDAGDDSAAGHGQAGG